MQKSILVTGGIAAGVMIGAAVARYGMVSEIAGEKARILKKPAYVAQTEALALKTEGNGEDTEEADKEAWFGTARSLSDYEWEILGQTIMAEARGESFQVQYYIACTVLNRVNSPLFPDTLAGVLYQTEPAVQFCGAWDTEQYEVTDSVWEAIQAAMVRNDLPEDVFYFTSEGYLEGTEAWKSVGNMWFSRQNERG